MEHIRQAIERAKTPEAPKADVQGGQHAPLHASPLAPSLGDPTGDNVSAAVILDGRRLEDNRIISHDIADPRSRSFDMLRTQVLQAMDLRSWQFLGITSPTAGCGKSVIAANLALSIARQRERSVLLIDLDLQKPQVARLLGLKSDKGIVSVLEGQTDLASAIVQTRVRNTQLQVLPCMNSTLNSSEWIASRQMHALLSDIKQRFRSWTVIFDLPPILFGDDVISILPQIDCALLVTAAGVSTRSQIRECTRHLESTPVVRVVVNKSADDAKAYYYSYGQVAGRRKAAGGRSSKRSLFGSVVGLLDRVAHFGNR